LSAAWSVAHAHRRHATTSPLPPPAARTSRTAHKHDDRPTKAFAFHVVILVLLERDPRFNEHGVTWPDAFLRCEGHRIDHFGLALSRNKLSRNPGESNSLPIPIGVYARPPTLGAASGRAISRAKKREATTEPLFFPSRATTVIALRCVLARQTGIQAARGRCPDAPHPDARLIRTPHIHGRVILPCRQ